MSNKEILNWWDNLGIVQCVKLREKYGYGDLAVLDVDDYRMIFENERKAESCNRQYYKEFKTLNEMEKFIKDFGIKTESIIDTKTVRNDLLCMWHYA